MIATPQWSLEDAGRDEFSSGNDDDEDEDEDETDDEYRQDVLSFLPLLDMGADDTIENKGEDTKEPRPLYNERSPSLAPSIRLRGRGGSSPVATQSGGTPHDEESLPDNNNSGTQSDDESSHDREDQ